MTTTINDQSQMEENSNIITRTGTSLISQKDFQHRNYFSSVRTQYVNINQRSVFGSSPPPSLQEWQTLADEFSNLNIKKDGRRKLSPSYQHLKLLHRMYEATVIRQLQFSPSTGIESEFSLPNQNVMLELDEENGKFSIENLSSKSNSSRRLSSRKAGSYYSINPVKAVLNAILEESKAPILCYKKYRIPTRSDVGLPNASEEEIRTKLHDAQLESFWEETSPRIILAATSNDLGDVILEDELDRIVSTSNPENIQFNNAGLPGMPYAGRDLQRAFSRNFFFFGDSSSVNDLNQFLPNRLFQSDPYSMLAPPLEATYSRSQGWRPRICHDRPPSMSYILACPISVKLEGVSPAQPFVGSLTLYKLSSNGNIMLDKKNPEMGKISESFWFPLGNWMEKIPQECKVRMMAFLKNGDKAGVYDDEDFFRNWLNRKHKAIFSYESSECESVPSNQHDSLSFFIVLEVYALAYNSTVDSNSTSRVHSTGNVGRSHRELGFLGKQHNSDVGFEEDKTSINQINGYNSESDFFLTLKCFGVTELFACSDCPGSSVAMPFNGISSSNTKSWPHGESKPIQLFEHLGEPSSQEAFVHQLCNLIKLQHASSTVSNDFPKNSYDSGRQNISTDRRLFRTPLKAAKRGASKKVSESPEVSRIVTTQGVLGEAEVVFSLLLSDFVKSLLSTPKVLESNFELKSKHPKFLVDLSGDFAVVLNPTIDDVSHAPSEAKRSDLERLPYSKEGYTCLSEYREVLYLPTSLEKPLALTASLSLRSLVNLLYIYPRMLRVRKLEQKRSVHFLSDSSDIRLAICMRLIRKDTSEESIAVTSLRCFHSQFPWTGIELLDSFYTSLISIGKIHNAPDHRFEVPLRDEAKLSLPKILDGTFLLEFTLIEVKFLPDGKICLTPAAKAAVPLTSLSSTDFGGGARVATIIPNGKHRLELGEFQFHFETRLVSALHLDDPSIAATIRDFPESETNVVQSIPAKFSSEPSLDDAKSSFQSLVSQNSVHDFKSSSPSFMTASAASIFFHVHVLFQLFLSNLIKPDEISPDETSRLRLTVGLKSIFELIEKVNANTHVDQMGALSKSYVDSFEECLFTTSIQAAANDLGSKNRESDSGCGYNYDMTSLNEEDILLSEVEKENAGLVRYRRPKRHRHSKGAKLDMVVPFGRVAFGTSKADRMRIEAELATVTEYYSQYFDDDETIATSFTMLNRSVGYTTLDSKLNESAFERARGATSERDDNSVLRSTSPDVQSDHNQSQHGTDFTRRVRIAAQVMLAPCVGPSLKTNASAEANGIARKSRSYERHEFGGEDSRITRIQYLQSPGTEDEYENHGSKDGDEQCLNDITSVCYGFRGASNIPIISFSLYDSEQDVFHVSHGRYLYESIISIWIQSYIIEMGGTRSESAYTISSFQKLTTVALSMASKTSFHSNGGKNAVTGFFTNLHFFLSLCLKSFVLRCTDTMETHGMKIALDKSHLDIMKIFVEMLSRGMVGEGLCVEDTPADRNRALIHVLANAKHVCDFLIGLAAVVHAEQICILLKTYLGTFRVAELEVFEKQEGTCIWTESSLQFVAYSRQLCLYSIERFSVLPSFVPLNFPSKYNILQSNSSAQTDDLNWLHQFLECSQMPSLNSSRYDDGRLRLPASGWLAELLLNEALSICSLSCQTIVNEATAQILHSQEAYHESEWTTKGCRKKPVSVVKRDDLLVFQSYAMHAISLVYELILRRHAMDKRFQSESCRSRIAAMFARPILQNSVANVTWLARLESSNKVRSVWLLCCIYVLQEAPEAVIREFIHSCCDQKDARLHRFVRLLRLCSSTFLYFAENTRNRKSISSFKTNLSTWLHQESYNTICATINIIVEEAMVYACSSPDDNKRTSHAILELFLFILTIPQSTVTHLRAMGGALHALEQFGVDLFLEVSASSLDHWARILFTLMNSTSLSVRSIATDFVISLIGLLFERDGNVDSLLLVFVTVLPEVAAREVALYVVSNHVDSFDSVSKCVWPMRRSIADVNDSDPSEDSRVDSQLVPILVVFCRTCQAILDGVLIELRMQKAVESLMGRNMSFSCSDATPLDSDEESLFEAATYFAPETAPVQRLRWLLTLATLHENKQQYAEAAEAFFMCAETIVDTIQHVQHVWRPSRFALWSDNSHLECFVSSPEPMDKSYNAAISDFASKFLEPASFVGVEWNIKANENLPKLSVVKMCCLLEHVITQCVQLYFCEDGMSDVAYSRVESILTVLLVMRKDYEIRDVRYRRMNASAMSFHTEESMAIRRVVACVSKLLSDLTSPSVEDEHTIDVGFEGFSYVFVQISGTKPSRFVDSITIPTFLEWDKPYVCRISKAITARAKCLPGSIRKNVCEEFANPLISLLKTECGADRIILHTQPDSKIIPNVTILDVYPLHVALNEVRNGKIPTQCYRLRHFFYKSDTDFIEYTVAHEFPYVLSRQQSITTLQLPLPRTLG